MSVRNLIAQQQGSVFNKKQRYSIFFIIHFLTYYCFNFFTSVFQVRDKDQNPAYACVYCEKPGHKSSKCDLVSATPESRTGWCFQKRKCVLIVQPLNTEPLIAAVVKRAPIARKKSHLNLFSFSYYWYWRHKVPHRNWYRGRSFTLIDQINNIVIKNIISENNTNA